MTAATRNPALEYLLTNLLENNHSDIVDIIGSHLSLGPGDPDWAAALSSRDGHEGYNLTTVELTADGGYLMDSVYLYEGAILALRDALNNRFPHEPTQ